jgi:hypothetical protein
MPALQTVISRLNEEFGKDGIKALVAKREAFAPGTSLNEIETALFSDTEAHVYRFFREYIGRLPRSIQEAFRAVIYYALSTDPPTTITFAWAPGYDYEVTIWQVPDVHPTRGGITMLLKSPYPKLET